MGPPIRNQARTLWAAITWNLGFFCDFGFVICLVFVIWDLEFLFPWRLDLGPWIFSGRDSPSRIAQARTPKNPEEG
jgi:hypothetical protein